MSFVKWTGPEDGDVDFTGKWVGPLLIPPERMPWGPPSAHEKYCRLLAPMGRFCDCSASVSETD